jgi:hypothetical protein
MASSGATGGVQFREVLGTKKEKQFGQRPIVSFDSILQGQQRIFACAE